MGSLGLARYCASIIVIAMLWWLPRVCFPLALISVYTQIELTVQGTIHFLTVRITNKLKIVSCHVVASQVDQYVDHGVSIACVCVSVCVEEIESRGFKNWD